MPFIQQYLPVFLYLSPHLLLSHTTLLHMVNIVQLSIACQVGKLSWISDANRFDCTFTKSQSPSNWMLNRFLKASLLLPPPPHATTCTDSVGNSTELTRQVSLLQQRFVSRHDPLPVLVLLVVVDNDDDDAAVAAGSSEVVVCRCHVGTFRNNQNLTWLLFHSTPSSTASSPSPSYSHVRLPPSAVSFRSYGACQSELRSTFNLGIACFCFWYCGAVLQFLIHRFLSIQSIRKYFLRTTTDDSMVDFAGCPGGRAKEIVRRLLKCCLWGTETVRFGENEEEQIECKCGWLTFQNSGTSQS